MKRTLATAIVLSLSALSLSCWRTQRHQGSNLWDMFFQSYSHLSTESERRYLLERFWKDVTKDGSPLIHENGTDVSFLYRGVTESVKLTGDMTGWADHLPMARLPGSDLFYITRSFESEARLDYKFILDNGEYILDPTNPRKAPGGYGENSELVMPEFVQAKELKEDPSRPKGMLQTLIHFSEVLGYEHEIRIYLPADYQMSNNRYPVVYFQDGSDYINFARVPTILDNVIEQTIPPVIGVLVVPPTSPERNRNTEYGMNNLYVKFFVEELVPFIDENYRTLAKPNHRLVIGDSYGGLISLYIAFKHPELFGNAASQSGFVSFGSDSLIREFRKSGKKPINLYFDVGTYERSLGQTGNPEGDFLEANRRLELVLKKARYVYEYKEFQGYHSWGWWRNTLPKILHYFFAYRS